MAKQKPIGVVRHDGKKVWVIPESGIPEKLRKSLKPCVWRPKQYMCDIVRELEKGSKVGPPHHKHHYDCLDCLKTQHDLKTIRKLLEEQFETAGILAAKNNSIDYGQQNLSWTGRNMPNAHQKLLDTT
ncbi:MAG: hypothetical protein V1839_01300 [archaeon]